MNRKFLTTITSIVCIALCNISNAQEAFDEFAVPKTFNQYQSYTEVEQPDGAVQTNVVIDPTVTVHKVKQSIFGQNAVGWQGDLNTSGVKEQHWKNANYSMMRYPGGNWSNIFFWDGTIPSSIKEDPAIKNGVSDLKSGTTGWMLETDEFPGLTQYLNSEPIVCVNVGWAFYGTDPDPVATAAQYAADWVDYYKNTLGYNVKYWELGNENYGAWQAGYALATPEKYAEACIEFSKAMKAVDPDIEIGVVLYEHAGGMSNTVQGKDWNEKIIPIVKDIMDFAILHQYPHPNTNRNAISEQEIYDATSTIEELTTLMEQQFETYAGKQYPIAITEFNARTGVRELSYTNALFITMMLGEMAKHDVEAAMQWDLQNGYDQYGGNHAAISSGDPFMNPDDANVTIYVHHYMNKYFGDTYVQGTSSNDNIIIYPTTFDSGEYGLVIVNRGTSDQVVELDYDNAVLGDRFYWHTIKGDGSDMDRTIYINDVGPSSTFTVGETYTDKSGKNSAVATEFEKNGVGGPQNYTEIMPYSSKINASENPKFSAPKLSVTYMILESAGAGCTAPDLGDDQFICGKESILIDSKLPEEGYTFKWYKNDVLLPNTSNTLLVEEKGTYKVEADNGICVAGDIIEISDIIPTPDLGSNIELCKLTSVELSPITTFDELSYEWLKDNQTVATTSSITASDKGLYTLKVSGKGCSDATGEVTVTSKLVDVTYDTICSAGEVTLTINLEGTYSWYNTPDDVNSISTQSIYSPTISSSTVYYVEDNNSEQHILGKSAVDGSVWGNTASGAYAGWGRTFEFTVDNKLSLISWDVNIVEKANVVINISGPNAYDKSFTFSNIEVGMKTLEMHETLEPGTYTVDLVGTTGGVSIQYDNNSNNINAGLLSWKCTDNEDHYGFFYNITVETGNSCARTPVYAVIDPLHPECGNSVTTQTIELKQGWNLVAVYVQTGDMSPLGVFANAEIIKTFSDFYKADQDPYLNSLNSIETGIGYLVYNSKDESLVISGEIKTSTPFSNLSAGWNLVGVSETASITDLPTNISIIKDFDSYYQKGNEHNSLSEVIKGKSYFIYVE